MRSVCFLPLGPETTVLDIGCGCGNHLRFFVDRGCQCFGVDVNDDMVELARSLLPEHVSLSKGRNDDLAFDDDTFDIVLSINTILYQDDLDGIERALGDFRRVLKPDGRLYIVTAGPEHEIVRSS